MESTRPRDVGIDPDRLEHFFAVVERLIERKWLRGGSAVVRGRLSRTEKE
jgi:hypothetical protein